MSDEFEIVKLLPEHAPEVAQLHISGISSGFISSLGTDFVTALYEGIAKSKSGISFVALKEGKVIGFAAFTTNLGSLYKSVIFSKGLKFIFILAWKMFSLRTIKRMFETLFYPNRIKKMELPSAEFLSMVIAEEGRGKGLASKFVKKGFAECARQGIEKLKILAAVDIKPINAMYQKYEFNLVGQLDSHGVKSNVYVVRTDHFDEN